MADGYIVVVRAGGRLLVPSGAVGEVPVTREAAARARDLACQRAEAGGREAGYEVAALSTDADEDRRQFEDLLGSLWLYVPWRFVTMMLATPQKELFADAVDAHGARLNADDPDLNAHPVDRWWREDVAS